MAKLAGIPENLLDLARKKSQHTTNSGPDLTTVVAELDFAFLHRLTTGRSEEVNGLSAILAGMEAMYKKKPVKALSAEV